MRVSVRTDTSDDISKAASGPEHDVSKSKTPCLNAQGHMSTVENTT